MEIIEDTCNLFWIKIHKNTNIKEFPNKDYQPIESAVFSCKLLSTLQMSPLEEIKIFISNITYHLTFWRPA